LIPVPESEAGSTPGSPSFTEARSRSASIETEKPESSSSGDTTSTQSDPDQSIHDPAEQQQEEVLAAQFEHGLDIEERLPADPEYPDEPVHLHQVEQAIEAGVEIPPLPPTIESAFQDPSWPPIPLLEEIEYFAQQSSVLPPEPEPITVQPPYQWYPPSHTPTPPTPLTPLQALTPPLQMAHQQPPHQAAGGGQAAGGQQAAGGGQQFTDKLRGVVPAMFNGNRNRSEDFLREFELFQGLNTTSDIMATPYLRVLYALSLMRGDNIKDWVRDQVTALNDRLNTHARDEEEHWTQFLTAFNRTFTDTAAQATAYHKLQDLKMNKDDLDSYIATFNHLATRAGFSRDAAATVDKFARGLKYDLLEKILSRDTPPDTMDGWIDAARTEQRKYARKQAMLHPGKKWFQWQTPQQNGRPRRHPNDQTAPMDVDPPVFTQIYKAYTEEDKRRHRDQGRCFNCSRRGHMARECPFKKTQNRPQKS